MSAPVVSFGMHAFRGVAHGSLGNTEESGDVSVREALARESLDGHTSILIELGHGCLCWLLLGGRTPRSLGGCVKPSVALTSL